MCDTSFKKLIANSQEAAINSPWIYIAVRERIGRWLYIRFHIETMENAEISVSDFLAFKERIVNHQSTSEYLALELDFGPFNRDFPKLKESRSIGRGVEFLNRRLSSQLFHAIGNGEQLLLDFLSVHQFQGMQLMLNDRIIFC